MVFASPMSTAAGLRLFGLTLIAVTIGRELALAALNKWRLGPALASTSGAAATFQRVVGAEYLLICAVLVVTAVMTTFFSPEP